MVIGDTVICSITVKNSTGTLVDPATSMTITIKNAFGVSVVSAQAMTKSSTGTYSYSWDSSGISVGGIYDVTYIANDGGVYSYGEDIFYLGTA
jgi:hypothetical protein